MLKNIDFTIQGERALFTEYAALIRLIETHFKPFDGQRAIIANGDRSAKFARVVSEFYGEAGKVKTRDYVRVTVNSSRGLSAWLNIDITLPSGDCGCVYFKHSVQLGNIDSFGENATGNFEYSFRADEARDHVSKILATTPEMLADARARIEKAKAEIEAAISSVPYRFRDCIISERYRAG